MRGKQASEFYHTYSEPQMASMRSDFEEISWGAQDFFAGSFSNTVSTQAHLLCLHSHLYLICIGYGMGSMILFA